MRFLEFAPASYSSFVAIDSPITSRSRSIGARCKLLFERPTSGLNRSAWSTVARQAPRAPTVMAARGRSRCLDRLRVAQTFSERSM